MDRADSAFLLLATATLVACASYLWLNHTEQYPGFQLDPSTWHVVQGEVGCTEANARCVRGGDRILSINGISRERFLADRTLRLPSASERLEITLRRDEQILEVVRAGNRVPPLAHRIEKVLTASTVLVFWAVGTLALLFVWPRDIRRLLLILVSYDTALWFATGAVSSHQVALSSVVFHIAVWLFLPLCTHLHLVLPSPWLTFTTRRRLVIGVYAFSFVAILLDLAGYLGPKAFAAPLVGALVVSLVSLATARRRGRDPETLWASRLMAFGVTFGLTPIMLVAVSNLLAGDSGLGQSSLLRALALSAVPVWPIAYGYAIYRHQLGAIEIRANRLLGLYGYAVMCLLVYALVLRLAMAFDLARSSPEIFGLVVVALFGGAAPIFFPWFQRTVNRLLLGMETSPQELLSVLAERLPRLPDLVGLRAVLAVDILPALLVRESGFYRLTSGGNIEVVLNQHPGRAPTAAELWRLASQEGKYLRQSDTEIIAFAWVRLVLCLESDDRLLGVWLFGRRDPDDFYPRSEIAMLERLAGQLAALLKSFGDRQEKEKLHELLAQSQKMEAVGRLSAGIAHDFNNLLAVIDMNTGFLLERLEGDPRRRYAEGVSDAAERASALTRGLLTFSRQRVVQPRAVDLGSMLEHLHPLLVSSAGGQVELEIASCEDLPVVDVDPGKLEQVIVNLTVNARDAMPEGGRLTITARSESGPALAEGSAAEHVVLSVSDSGTGIDPEILSKVFEPFFTTKPPGQGTGLGLSLAYGVIKQCGGRIDVDSELGRGTTFHIHLPVAGLPESESPSAEGEAIVERPPPARILVVDDEKPLRTVLREALEAVGHEVTTAGDGLEALDRIEAGSFDLLVSDVVMPRLGGVELAQEVRNLAPELKILLISGYTERHGADALGTDGRGRPLAFLHKPFSNQQFLQAVQDALSAGDPD